MDWEISTDQLSRWSENNNQEKYYRKKNKLRLFASSYHVTFILNTQPWLIHVKVVWSNLPDVTMLLYAGYLGILFELESLKGPETRWGQHRYHKYEMMTSTRLTTDALSPVQGSAYQVLFCFVSLKSVLYEFL